MVIMSLFWRGFTARGAIAAMIVGFISIPIFRFLMPLLPEVGDYFVALEALPPAFLMSFVRTESSAAYCSAKLKSVSINKFTA